MLGGGIVELVAKEVSVTITLPEASGSGSGVTTFRPCLEDTELSVTVS